MSRTTTNTSTTTTFNSSSRFPGRGYVLSTCPVETSTAEAAPQLPSSRIYSTPNGILRIVTENIPDSIKINADKDLYVAMDFSGSMGGYYKILNQIIKTVVDDNPTATNVHIICYGSGQETYAVANYPRYEQNGYGYTIGDLIRGEDFRFSKGTDFIPPINKLIDLITTNDSIPIVYFFTDGQAYSYSAYAARLLTLIQSRNGEMRPIVFGRGAHLDNFGPVQSFSTIEALQEELSSVYASLATAQTIELSIGDRRVPVRLTHQANGQFVGAIMNPFPTTTTTTPMTYTLRLEHEAPIPLTYMGVSEEVSDEDLIYTLQTIVTSPGLYSHEKLRKILDGLKTLNNKMSSDPRVQSLNNYRDQLISMMPSSGGGQAPAMNVSYTRNFVDILQRMTRGYSAIIEGKNRRSVKTAAVKLSKYAHRIDDSLNKFRTLGLPRMQSSLAETDNLDMPIEGETVSFTVVVGPGNASSIEKIFEALEQGNAPSQELLALSAAINNPASALIRTSSNGNLSLDSLRQVSDSHLLERLALSDFAIFIPYANHDPEWLKSAYNIYAGLLIVSHPIRLQARAPEVFTTALTSMLYNTRSDSLHHFRTMTFLYGYAQTYMLNEGRMDLMSQYSSDPLAIYHSRAEGSDGLLSNIGSTLGMLLVSTGPRIDASETQCFDSTEGLRTSVLLENSRQIIRYRAQSNPKIYTELLNEISESIGFSSYQETTQRSIPDDLFAILENKLRSADVPGSKVTLHDIRKYLEELVEIKFDDFISSFTNTLGAIFEKYLPSSTNRGTTVPAYYSQNDLSRLLGMIRKLTQVEWLNRANDYLGMLPDDMIQEFIECRFDISPETMLHILVYLGHTECNTTKMLETPYSQNITKLLPLSKQHHEIQKARLIKLINDLFSQALTQAGTPPFVLGGLLKLGNLLWSTELLISNVCNVIPILIKRPKELAKLLDIIGSNILDDSLKAKLISVGMPSNMIQESRDRYETAPGVICPSLRHSGKSFRKVIDMIMDNPDSRILVQIISDDKIIISGADVRRALSFNPKLASLGGYRSMIKANYIEFTLMYRPQDSSGYWQPIKINEFSKQDIINENGNHYWSPDIQKLNIFN